MLVTLNDNNSNNGKKWPNNEYMKMIDDQRTTSSIMMTDTNRACAKKSNSIWMINKSNTFISFHFIWLEFIRCTNWPATELLIISVPYIIHGTHYIDIERARARDDKNRCDNMRWRLNCIIYWNEIDKPSFQFTFMIFRHFTLRR